VPLSNTKLKYNTAYSCFKKLLKNAGLNEKLYALHSPRVGATTEAFQNKVPGHVIDLRGRWKSEQTKKRYCRPPEKSWLKYFQ
jgi:hypothetical protein